MHGLRAGQLTYTPLALLEVCGRATVACSAVGGRERARNLSCSWQAARLYLKVVSVCVQLKRRAEGEMRNSLLTSNSQMDYSLATLFVAASVLLLAGQLARAAPGTWNTKHVYTGKLSYIRCGYNSV